MPDPAFRWSDEPWGVGLRCRPLESAAQHLLTTRQLGLPDARGWARAAQSMAVAVGQIKRIHQVHGRVVHVWRRGDDSEDPAPRPQADAQISNDPSHVLAVQVADCVPILVADVRRGAAAAIHAGWRGSAARIIDATVAALHREFQSNPDDLLAAVGPSIGACCYRVGEELLDAFARGGASDLQLSRWFTRDDDSRLRLDLWLASRDQLVEAGVRPDRVFVAHLCTQTHVELFESFRAEGERAGRMAALIRVPAPA